MNMVRASVTLLVVLGAALVNFVGCTADDPPPDTASGGSGGSSSGTLTTCGDGKLDTGEACDDGNNGGLDGCTQCAVDECYTCTNEAGALSTCTFAASGATCESTKVCDGAGKCVDCVEDAQCTDGYCNQNVCAKCSDGLHNGDETDTDCGGMHCMACEIAKTCVLGTDCASTFCVDGRCCGDACDGECQACNIAGSEGTCDFVPRYGEDLMFGTGESCLASANMVCNGGGTCANALQQPCSGNTACASGKCVDPTGGNNKVCIKNTGDACMMNAECWNNMCDMTTMKCL
mgnify:CR=1 FL=1